MANSNNNQNPLKDYIKYSGIAFQMIVIICLSAFLGNWIDKHFDNKIPIFTLILSLSGVALSIYQLIRTIK
ncbi:MAG: AtpZ/AtpI family protein [Bacteroidetes bacterium]|nr:AtpZ/AtpI family protein [Bacteroidota bacterium]